VGGWDVDPCVFLSVHVEDWVGAFGGAVVRVARRVNMSPEELVSYVAYSPPQAVTVASLLCKLADFGRVCQYAVTGGRAATHAYKCRMSRWRLNSQCASPTSTSPRCLG